MTEHPSWTSFPLPDGEPVTGKTYRADGWSYHPPYPTWISLNEWILFTSVLGSDNHHILNLEEKEDEEHGTLVQGELLISPLGRTCIDQFLNPSRH